MLNSSLSLIRKQRGILVPILDWSVKKQPWGPSEKSSMPWRKMIMVFLTDFLLTKSFHFNKWNFEPSFLHFSMYLFYILPFFLNLHRWPSYPSWYYHHIRCDESHRQNQTLGRQNERAIRSMAEGVRVSMSSIQCVLSMQACPLPSQGASVTHSSGGNKVDLFQSVLKTYSVLHLQLEDNVHNNISSYWCDILCDSHDTTSIFCSYHLCLNVLLHIW